MQHFLKKKNKAGIIEHKQNKQINVILGSLKYRAKRSIVTPNDEMHVHIPLTSTQHGVKQKKETKAKGRGLHLPIGDEHRSRTADIKGNNVAP
jgi:hypothetical protein